jgi:BirA family biotin operon repressor/biotin-[acetyl-CoA-carboxylase] ligase
MMLTRRAAIARALALAGPAGVSGEALARDLGVSRVAIGKHVAALRELGYGIVAAPGAGYRLETAPDACIPEEVAWRLADPFWVACEGGPETGSTNDDAKRRARAGAPEGTLIVAARQSAGRGRFGRTWVSPGGGAYLSAVLRPSLAPASLGPLGLAVALGVARALEGLGVPTALKWPNDVLADGRKVAGILVEMTAEADRTEWVVVGCGVNVRRAPEDGAWVGEWAQEARVADVAAAVCDGIAAVYREFVTAGFGALADEYRAHGALWGRPVTVRDATGLVQASGIAETVDEDGFLVVAGPGGRIAVAAGDVTLRSGVDADEERTGLAT